MEAPQEPVHAVGSLHYSEEKCILEGSVPMTVSSLSFPASDLFTEYFYNSAGHSMKFSLMALISHTSKVVLKILRPSLSVWEP